MRKLLTWIVIMLAPVCLKSQDLHLQDCVSECLKNNPLSSNKALAIQVAEVKSKIIRSAWLPGLDLNGQASWQSDVVTLDLNLPFEVNLPQIPKDQYKVTSDVTQLIYDGGNIKNQQVLEKINADLSINELEINEQSIRQSAEDLYFAILVTDKRIEVLNLMAESLQQTARQIESGVKNGLLGESDLPVIRAEQIKLDQQLISLKGLKARATNTLGILMGREIPLATRFTVPNTIDASVCTGERPEYQMFELQNNRLSAQKTLLNTQRRPKILAFGQAGVGKPGLNFLSDQSNPFLIVGLKGTWNIWDWSKVNHQKETLDLNTQIVNNQQKSFSMQVSQAEQKQKLLINEINALLQKDEQLLSNRKEVTAAYNSRLKNGMITASQFLNEWTHEQEARINQEVRKIELINAEYKLLSIMGKTYNYEIN